MGRAMENLMALATKSKYLMALAAKSKLYKTKVK